MRVSRRRGPRTLVHREEREGISLLDLWSCERFDAHTPFLSRLDFHLRRVKSFSSELTLFRAPSRLHVHVGGKIIIEIRR